MRNILIRGANWLGDAVMTIPALREVRRIFAQARITMWTKQSLHDLFTGTDLVDDVLPAQGDSIGLQARSIRAGAFDLAILFQNSFRAALVTWLGRVPLRCGYQTYGRGFLLTHPIPVDPALRLRHQVIYYLNLVAQLERAMVGYTDVDCANPNVHLPVRPELRREGLRLLAEHGIDRSYKLVLINPGATNSRAKQWHAERFAAVADQLLSRGDSHVAIIGAPEEARLAQMIAQQMLRHPTILTGRTTLRQLLAVMSYADLLISNDTGPAHLAAAIGVPTLVIFGPTEYWATRPLAECATVVRQPVGCAPCMLRECPIDHRCMTRITINDVLTPATAILDAATVNRAADCAG
ncbi:MAG: lipopolysaccharide heptosyltransferase II [Acidobacteriota bacterium]|nr:lipopolysaccharide heptosyltransferase II [Blastocatellia bacterium]MDW8238254.1 lipopolysaccharide heptosyltransferase II [Acidobacteriota bacterium]